MSLYVTHSGKIIKQRTCGELYDYKKHSGVSQNVKKNFQSVYPGQLGTLVPIVGAPHGEGIILIWEILFFPFSNQMSEVQWPNG